MQNDFADAVFWVHKGHVGCRKRQLEWMPVERDEKPVFVLTEGACFGESRLDEVQHAACARKRREQTGGDRRIADKLSAHSALVPRKQRAPSCRPQGERSQREVARGERKVEHSSPRALAHAVRGWAVLGENVASAQRLQASSD